MNKNNIKKWCNVIDYVLIACFIVKTIVEYINYSDITNSAPFYVFAIVNAMYFLLPALIVFMVGLIVKIKT